MHSPAAPCPDRAGRSFGRGLGCAALTLMLCLPGGASGAIDPRSGPDSDGVSLNPRECREGADFIRNAALSRDAGISAEQFTARVESDIITVMQLPRELRWFVYGEPEAAMLRSAVGQVFHQPASPQRHWDEFLARCSAALRASKAG